MTGWTFIVTNWVYQISFSFTCGPLWWIIPAEVFNTKTRSKGVSIGVMTSFAFNTVIGQTTPVAMDSVGWRYFLLFVVCNFTNAIFFWALLPETARLPLEAMNKLFSGNVWFVASARGRKVALGGAVRHVVMILKRRKRRLRARWRRFNRSRSSGKE